MDLRFRPYQEARTLTADGTYLVYGSRQQSQDLLQEFERLGYRTAWSQVPSVTGQLSGFGAGALSTFILAIALVVVVSVVSSVLLNAKFYGVQRLHGRSLTIMVAGDVRRGLVVAGVVVLAVNLLLGLPLHLYNDFHQVGRFLGLELAITAALTALALIVQALTVILLQRSAILEAVSGRVNAGWAFAGSYVLRGWSLLLALTIVSSGLTALWTLDDARAAHRIWTASGEAYYLRVSAAIEYAKSAPDLDARIGEALRQADNRNEVSIAARYTLPESGRDLLVVNKRYLDQHELRDATGARWCQGRARSCSCRSATARRWPRSSRNYPLGGGGPSGQRTEGQRRTDPGRPGVDVLQQRHGRSDTGAAGCGGAAGSGRFRDHLGRRVHHHGHQRRHPGAESGAGLARAHRRRRR